MSKRPKISIGLPTRNSMRFLQERIDSILCQTFTDWELVAVDGESDDGTWEHLLELAKRDPRIKPEQSPPRGIYPAFNRCIERSSGDYVYIATSDDTMAPDCLEKMAEALEANPDCDLAHCPMRVIGADGKDGLDWWVGQSLFSKSSGRWLGLPHKRMAPHDGVLCLLGDNIYSSVTQLLIRKSLFGKIGLYPTGWGSIGDFHWNLRAGLMSSAVHVPGTWASWRMHEAQATAAAGLGSGEHERKIDGMIDEVLSDFRRRGVSIPERVEAKASAMRKFLRGFSSRGDSLGRKRYVLASAFRGSGPAWGYLFSLIPGGRRWPEHAPECVRKWLDEPIRATS